MELEKIESPAGSGCFVYTPKSIQVINEVITAHGGRITASQAIDLVQQDDFEIDRLYVGAVVQSRQNGKEEALIFGRTFAACEKDAVRAARHAKLKKFTLLIQATRRDLLLNRNYLRLRGATFETLSTPYGIVVCRPMDVQKAMSRAVAHG